MPRLKKANRFDEVMFHDKVKDGEYYITMAKYIWRLEFYGEAMDSLIECKSHDPEVIAATEKLKPDLEAANKNAIRKDTDQPSE